MQTAYCRSCFRDLPPGVETCAKCTGPAGGSRSSLAFGFLTFSLVMAGMLVPDIRLCMLGAALSVLGIAVYLFRVLRANG